MRLLLHFINTRGGGGCGRGGGGSRGCKSLIAGVSQIHGGLDLTRVHVERVVVTHAIARLGVSWGHCT